MWVVVFSGQTGSGKTYTMQGPISSETGEVDYELRGIIPRCFEYLFGMMAREEKKSNGQVQYLCRASFCEIYNEFVYDLLDSASPACSIREDIKRGVYVDGITEESINSPEDAYRILNIGARNRHVAATSMNRESSRSHSVFTLIIQSKITDGSITDVRESRFNLVDLAGSERQKLTATTGMRLKEAGNINKSLLALGNVINALVDISNGKQRHIHYRDSKLTFLLRDSLGGNAKTFIIANVSPSVTCAAESLSTLRFASRAKMIKNRAIVNQEFHGNVFKLQEEIARLKHELLLAQAQQSSKLSIDGLDELDNFSELDSDNKELRLMALLTCVLKRYKKSEAEKARLYEQQEALQTVVDAQKNQIQSDKMIIKFRDNSINLFRKQKPETLDEEKKRMQSEIAELKRIVDFHPEVNRFAAENLELRESLSKFEEYLEDLHHIEDLQIEWKKYEMALGDQIISFMEELKSATAQGNVSFGGESNNTPLNNKGMIHRLKSEVERLSSSKQYEIGQLKAISQGLQHELDMANKRISEMTEESESLVKLNTSLEESVGKLRAENESQLASGIAVNSTDQIEQMLAQTMDLKAENDRLKQKLETFEVKSRRLSDFAHESRQLAQNQLHDLKGQLESVSRAKEESEKKFAEISEEIDSLTSAKSDLESSLQMMAAQKEDAEKEKDDLEQEVLRYVSEIKKKDEQLEEVTRDYQAAKDELEDMYSQIEIYKSQIREMEDKNIVEQENMKYMEKSLRDSLAKITNQEEEISKLEQALNNQNDASSELAAALHQSAKQTQELSDLEAKVTSMQDALEQAFKEKRVQDEVKTRLEHELDREKKTIAEMHQTFMEDRQELLAVKKELVDAQSDNESLHSLISELTTRNAELDAVRNEKERVQAALEISQEDNSDLLNRIKELNLSPPSTDREAELELAVAELQRQIKEKADSILASESNLKAERSRIQAISEKLDSLDELRGKNHSLEQQFEYILKRNEELEEANGKLVKHNNFKQKLQYHLQIKQENNQLRQENQHLQVEVEKLQRRIIRDDPAPAVSTAHRTKSNNNITSRSHRNVDTSS